MQGLHTLTKALWAGKEDLTHCRSQMPAHTHMHHGAPSTTAPVGPAGQVLGQRSLSETVAIHPDLPPVNGAVSSRKNARPELKVGLADRRLIRVLCIVLKELVAPADVEHSWRKGRILLITRRIFLGRSLTVLVR